MTDKEKLDKLVAEIKWLIGDYNIKTEKYRGINEQAHQYYGGKRDALSGVLKSIDTMQEESKVCMYSTANYTNADRLTLCKDCKELCRYNQKTAAESLCISQEVYDEIVDKCLYSKEPELVDDGDLPKEEPVNKDFEMALAEMIDKAQKCFVEPLVVAEQWKDELIKLAKREEPVSEDLEEAGKEWLKPQLDKSYANYGEAKMMELTHFDGYAMLDAIEFGANWKEQQMEAYRIEHCKSLTNEQAELEENFVSSHVEKNNRIPTFIDAIEYGMEYCKQQLMAKAVDAVVKVDAGGYPYIDRTIELYDYDKDIPLAKRGDKYKVILIKEV